MLFNLTISSPSPLIALGSLVFNGTAVWLNSAWVASDTAYTVTLDSDTFAATRQPAVSSLYNAKVSTTSVHNLTIVPASLLDSVVVEMDLNSDLMMTMDDTQLFSDRNASVVGSWVENQCLGTGRSQGTCHTTSGANSAITYTFQGDAITVWGSVENTLARYSVSIDGAAPESYSSNNVSSSRPTVVLAHGSNLGSGDHVITITSMPLDGTSRLEIDYVQLYTLAVSSTNNPGSAGTELSKTTKIALIVGTLVGCVLLAVGFFIYLLSRQNALMRQAAAADKEANSGAQHTNSDSGSMDFGSKEKEFDMETLASGQYSVSSLNKMPNFSVTARAHPMGSEQP